MSLDFYVFNVEHGQAAALKLPDGEWCLFDFGRGPALSPVTAIAVEASKPMPSELTNLAVWASLSFLRCTLSHFHGDHLSDLDAVCLRAPRYFRTVDYDQHYVEDALENASDERARLVERFLNWLPYQAPSPASTSHAGATIRELDLGVTTARALGGTANARVNNASIVSRIDYLGRSILICGDMEATGWDTALATEQWQRHVANVDVLVAPHHGHTSGFSSRLLELAQPTIVLVSVASYDPNVDGRYSQPPVKGVQVHGETRRCFTTRRDGHLRLTVSQGGSRQGDMRMALANGTWVDLDGSGFAEIVAAVLSARVRH